MPSLKQSLAFAAELHSLVALGIIGKAQANAKFLKHSGIALYKAKPTTKKRSKKP